MELTHDTLLDLTRSSLRIPLDHTIGTRPGDPLIAAIPDGETVSDELIALASQVVGHQIVGIKRADGTSTFRPNAARIRAELRRHVRRLDA